MAPKSNNFQTAFGKYNANSGSHENQELKFFIDK